MKKVIEFYSIIFFSFLNFSKKKYDDSEPHHISAYFFVVIPVCLNILFFIQIIGISINRFLATEKFYLNLFLLVCLIIACLFYFLFLNKKKYRKKYKIIKTYFWGISTSRFIWIYFSFSFILPILTSIIQRWLFLASMK